MDIIIEKDDPYLRVKKIFSIFMIAGYIASILVLAFWAEVSSEPVPVLKLTPLNSAEGNLTGLNTIQGNSLLAVSSPVDPVRPPKKIKVVLTAYSSTPWETDDTPYITASGKMVKDGIVANNLLPFGTQIRIPEIYGDKVFVVEDRMHWSKSYYQLDIWFPDYWQAKDFGAKRTYIEILES